MTARKEIPCLRSWWWTYPLLKSIILHNLDPPPLILCPLAISPWSCSPCINPCTVYLESVKLALWNSTLITSFYENVCFSGSVKFWDRDPDGKKGWNKNPVSFLNQLAMSRCLHNSMKAFHVFLYWTYCKLNQCKFVMF